MPAKPRKIFVSHHHTDARSLGKLKSLLEPTGFQCFLAHIDINPGEHDLDRIEKEIRGCDAFLYVCNDKSNHSQFCQQEIGMAKALGKKIITTKTKTVTKTTTKDHLPSGFIARLQAIHYTKIDKEFYDNLYWRLIELFPPSPTIKAHLKSLGVKGFSRNADADMVRLIDDNWNDYGFTTTFAVRVNGVPVGHAKIGYLGQTTQESTHGHLASSFTHIQLPFFSRVLFASEPGISAKKMKSLQVLLNDTGLMANADKNKVSVESVYKTSLFR